MDKFDRICQLHQEFSNHRYPVKVADLATTLECSERTIMRCIHQLRDRLSAPLEYVAAQHGWRYDPDCQTKFELPGLWMTETELVSLMLLLSILETFGESLLSQEIHRMNAFVTKLISDRGLDRETIITRLKIIPVAQRTLPTKTLYVISEATFKRKKIKIDYEDFNAKKSQRTVSPQTLVYYRDNWYFDAWCHLRNDLRTFSIARISNIKLLKLKAKDIPQKKLQEYFPKSYGIFSGKPKHTAKLKFSPSIAKEISMQSWHPNQTSSWQDDYYILEIPYRKSDELVMDIMRYLPQVEILEPAELKKIIKNRIEQAYEILNN